MRDLPTNLQGVVAAAHRRRGLLLPSMAAALVLVLLVPLPPVALDFLLVLNMAVAAVVLLMVVSIRRPLDMSVFPTVLLLATLGRLVLNVATTRLILTAGSDGRSAAEANLSAGQVVWGFGSFVTGDSLVVGVIVFSILVAIQFLVVTKGTARVSEVAARFVLDAMPGKQLAVDQELSSRLIDESQARERRREISREADFYGAMDGAGKFLRGDAVAALLIIMINLVGGLYVGLVQRGWGLEETVALFTRLTIGEGLAMQVPAFVLAVAAALLVTRSTARVNLGEEFVGQLTARPAVLVMAAIFLGLLALTRLPTVPLLAVGASLAGLAWLLSGPRPAGGTEAETDESASIAHTSADEHDASTTAPAPADLVNVDPIRVEIGYSLVKLTHGDGRAPRGLLLDRLADIRRDIARELGILVPPIRLTDNASLGAHAYAIYLRGAKIAQGQLHPKLLLAVADESELADALDGIESADPVSGGKAIWIHPDRRAQADALGCRIAMPAAVLSAHLADVIRSHAGELLTRSHAQALLDALAKRCPQLVDEALAQVGAGTIVKVLQALLRERVSIRDLEMILEAICEAPPDATLARRVELVRAKLGRWLCQPLADRHGQLWCVRLDERYEEALAESALEAADATVALDASQSRALADAVGPALEDLRRQGRRGVVVCSPLLRRAVKQAITVGRTDAAVLSYDEVDAVSVHATAYVGTHHDA
ncbi:MAG: flagellar biosynthesis protein FlhA [Phycisphaerae bacterium]|nr:flagellar biosynthesis protein FlhA [Phycisphaerae bacterium]